MSKRDTEHECKDISDNVEKYCQMRGIVNLKALIKMIGAELGDRDLDSFYEKEKGNFSSMINGRRPLKFEFIRPLERILGVSLARLYDEDSFLLPRKKEDIPFLKGFRYYAYKDDMDLYINEFESTMISGNGVPSIVNLDEFQKSFLDYVIEYKSLNALRYLAKEHFLAPIYSGAYNSFFIDRQFRISCHEPNGVLKMVIREDDPDLFNIIFDAVQVLWARYNDLESAHVDEEVIELILNSDNVFDSLFVPHKYLVNELDRNIYGRDNDKVDVLNPFLNICLDYALTHDLYKKRAIQILEFGSIYNHKILESTHEKIEELYIREDGRLYLRGDRALLGTLVYSGRTSRDYDLRKLLEKLPQIRTIQ